MSLESMSEDHPPMEFVPGKQRFSCVDPAGNATEFHENASHPGGWIHAHPRIMIQVFEQDLAEVRQMEETVCLCPDEQGNPLISLETGAEEAGTFQRPGVPGAADVSRQIPQHAEVRSSVVTPTSAPMLMAVYPFSPLRHTVSISQLSRDGDSDHAIDSHPPPHHHPYPPHRQSCPDLRVSPHQEPGSMPVQRPFPSPSQTPVSRPPTPGPTPRPTPYPPLQARPPFTRYWPSETAEMPASFWVRFRQELDADRIQLRQELTAERDQYRQQLEAHMNKVHLEVESNHDRVLDAMAAHVQQIREDIETSTEDMTKRINAVDVMPDWFENWLTVWYDYQTDFVKSQRRFHSQQRTLGLQATAMTTVTTATTVPDNVDVKPEFNIGDDNGNDNANDDDDNDSDYYDGGRKINKGKIRQPSRIIARPPTKPKAPQSKQSSQKVVAPAPKTPRKRALIQKSKASCVATAAVPVTQTTSTLQDSASESDVEEGEWTLGTGAATSGSLGSYSGKTTPANKPIRARAPPKQPKKKGGDVHQRESQIQRGGKAAPIVSDAALKTKKRGSKVVQGEDTGEMSPKRCKTESSHDDSPRSTVPDIIIVDADDDEEEGSVQEIDFGDVDDEEEQEPEGKLGAEGEQESEKDREQEGDNADIIKAPSHSRKRPQLPSESSTSPAPSTSLSSSSSSSNTSSSSNSSSSSSSSSSTPGSSSARSASEDEGRRSKKERLDTSPEALVKFIKKHGKANGRNDRDVDIYLHTRNNAREFYALLDANPKAVNLLDLQIRWDFNDSDMEAFVQCLERSFIRELVIYQPADGTVDDGKFAARLLQNKKLSHLMLRHFTDFLQQPELDLPLELSHLKDIELTFQIDRLSSPHLSRVREFFRRLTRLERVILRSPPDLCQEQLIVLKRILTSIAAEATTLSLPSSSSSSSSSPRLPPPTTLMILFRCCRNIVLRVEVDRTTAEFRSIELLHRSLCKADIQWAKLLAIPCCRSIPNLDIQSTFDDTWVQSLLEVTASRRTRKTEAPLKELILDCTHIRSTARVKDLATILHEFKDSLTAVGLTDFKPMATNRSDELPPPLAAKGGAETARRTMVSGWKTIFSALNWQSLEWLDLSFSNIGFGEIALLIEHLCKVEERRPTKTIRKLIIVTDALSTNEPFRRLARTIQDKRWGEFVAIKEKK